MMDPGGILCSFMSMVIITKKNTAGHTWHALRLAEVQGDLYAPGEGIPCDLAVCETERDGMQNKTCNM